MRVDYLVGFIQYLEREHDISLVAESFDELANNNPNVHKISEDKHLELAKQYRHHVINTGEI